MEKLFELLQIYIIERQGREQFKLHGDKIILWRPYKLRRFPQYDTNAVIISKRFGFIQRLVENGEIDLEKLDKKLLKIGIHKNIGFYEGLLMLLSIQDEPINFLISILR